MRFGNVCIYHTYSRRDLFCDRCSGYAVGGLGVQELLRLASDCACSCTSFTFTILWANTADDKLLVLFLFFPENTF